MSKYFKNFILCGDIDYHCLLCKESFQTVDDLEKHIRWEKHRKSIKNVAPVPKFKKDSIYKINEKYYCECCNCIEPTIAAISKHLEETTHHVNKANPVTELKGAISKRESGLIVVGKTKITNREWFGVVDQKCVFCDIVVDNFVKHITLSSHMINMIQSQILIYEDQYYRKVNKERCYCFLCKKTFPAHSLKEHWMEKLHVEKTEAQNGNKDTKADRDKKLDIAVKLINSQKEYFDIDLDNKVAKCKLCTAYVNINFKFMIEHKKTHNINDKDKLAQVAADMEAVLESLKKPDGDKHVLLVYDHGKQRAELAKFGRDNFIKLIFPGSKGYCSVCSTYISAHMKNFIEHIRGQVHMGHLELKGIDKSINIHIKPNYRTKKMKDYLKSIIHAKDLNVLWVNKKHCIDIFCFMLLSVVVEKDRPRKIKCHACDIIYTHDKDKEHCQTTKHREVFLNSELILTFKDEFVREIHPNLYHCGVCNLTFPFCETLEKHLQSWKHVFTKNDQDPMHKLTEQWYGGITYPSLSQERVYSHLMNLGII